MNEASETTSLIEALPGGRELLDWFDGSVHFHDAEIIALYLERDGRSRLTLDVGQGSKAVSVTFSLEHWIDVHLDGFSQQNVIFDLKLRRVAPRQATAWELGVDAQLGVIEIELEPCFGANGTIRANVSAVTFDRPQRPGERSLAMRNLP